MNPRLLAILMVLGWLVVVWFLMHHLGCSVKAPC